MARPKPLAKAKLRSNDRRHYYHIFLWATQEEYEQAAKVEGEGTLAVCITNVWADEHGNATVNPKLGELHFVSGTWCVNTVSHECLHAILHRLRYCNPTPLQVLDEHAENYDPDDEEVIAYEMGDWVEAAMRWLTNTDPDSPYPKSTFDI